MENKNSFSKKYPEGKVTADKINFVYNFEVIRDYCGSLIHVMYESNDDEIIRRAEYVHHLPEAIHVMVKSYHIEYYANGCHFTNAESSAVVKNIQGIIIHQLEEVKDSLMDIKMWDDVSLLNNVYDLIYIDHEFIGSFLKLSVESIINSDYNRAKKYVRSIEDPELKKILNKALHGIKPDRFKSYHAEFEQQLREFGYNTRFMDSIGGRRYFYDENGNETGSIRLW